jgi:TonB-linked SusC/RagA family outer membrane protein
MKTIFCLVVLLCPYIGFSQHRISGRVIGEDGAPLTGAAIKLVSSRTSAIAGTDGKFTITASVFPDSLIISHTGYTAYRNVLSAVPVAGFTVAMQQLSGRLDEVIVSTGYESLPKERSAGSFAKLDETMVNRRVSTNAMERLEGIVPGLVFNRNTSLSASGKPDISIRGQSTIFANAQPLIVVDNFPYDGDLNNINAADIESVTVLKDAAAASIWGARSGNGVIVITTRKGKRNQPLSMNFSTSLNFGQRPDVYYSRAFIPSSDFIDLEQELFKRGYYDADLSSAARPVVSPVVELLSRRRSNLISQTQLDAQLAKFRTIDYRHDISDHLYQQSLNQQYAFSISGGSANAAYAVSLGSDINRSNIVGNDYTRQTMTSQFSIYPMKNLSLSFGLAYTKSNVHNNGVTNISTNAGKQMVPYASLVDSAGNPAALVHDYRKGYLDTAGGGLLLDWSYRPLDEQKNNDQSSALTDTRINLGALYSFPFGLKAEIRYQYEGSATTQRQYFGPLNYDNRHLINRYTSIAGSTVTRPIPLGGQLDQSDNTMRSQRLRGQLDYSLQRGKHQLNALAGAEISQVTTDRSAHRWYGYDDEIGSFVSVDYVTQFKQYVTGGTARIPNIDALGKTDNRFISYYSNAAYTYNGKYTVNASARVDKSNYFGVNANNRQVPLWSTGAVWAFDKEKFYGIDWLPRLRFRVSYGYNANYIPSLTAYTTATYSSSSPYYSGYPYATITSPANPSLRWEKIRMLNFGIDFSLKDGWLSGSLEYYHKQGIDLAGESPLPPSTGFTSYTGNYAQTAGDGFDIQLNNHIPVTKSLSMNNTFIVSGIWEKITSYDVTNSAGNYILNSYGNAGNVYPLEGKPLYSLFAYRWAGLDPNTGEPQGYLNGKVSKDYANIIAAATVDSMTFSGRTRPPLTASWRPEFSWKQWSLSALFVGKFDYVWRRSALSYSGLFNSWAMNADYMNRWQKPSDEQFTDVPSIQYPPVNSQREQFYSLSESMIEKADNIRLQDIRLSWRWARSLHPKLPFQSMDFYLYANNLGIVWTANKKGLYPDLFIGSMPLPKSIALGLNIHF